ncbi:hypothetical protein P152DRAFT_453300 [Eremomyces bilateralis CBS 781.70]|uniref:Uncharacterized protein n=1 Tax=Eremomyces bilateralis CBS 781.70 TaxID=1392243 RepID=A0A6G1FQC3_9PEZI|nr:uncharacterized protein P152DRAFT_453300 [Eremomyces bilateralis CBS 781.70]KAF1807928.1 hypothetical protein P152DRAFT_453300 [Eremomyces bilateralis CBS 781.70]
MCRGLATKQTLSAPTSEDSRPAFHSSIICATFYPIYWVTQMEEKHIEELLRQLSVERRRAEEAQRRAEAAEHQQQREQQRAEEERQRAEEEQQRAEEAQQRAAEAEQQRQTTTLTEYIGGCHNFLSTKFAVQPDKSLTSKGSITDPRCHDEFGIGNGIVFENHPNIASDVAEEPRERIMSQTPLPRQDRTYSNFHQLRADQICVYKYDGYQPDRRRMTFVVEYKAPHKLTLPHLRLGLREMDVYNDVVNRATKPATGDVEALFQYTSDRLAAAALVQTFNYMIEGGLEYSYLTTGEAFVFLKIDWGDPGALYYHLAEPNQETRAHPETFSHCTAVSQVLAFTLLALESPIHGQDERHRAMKQLHTWNDDYESILCAVPPSERKQSPPPSAYQPRTYKHVDRSHGGQINGWQLICDLLARPYDYIRLVEPPSGSYVTYPANMISWRYLNWVTGGKMSEGRGHRTLNPQRANAYEKGS